MNNLPNHQHRRAFTLVELLVVVAVIALLIGLLLPALSQARSAGYRLVGSNTQRQLALGVQAYTSDNDQWIPGCNTSGFIYANPGQALAEAALRSNKSGDIVLQKWDWFVPAIAGTSLPGERAKRWRVILDNFADPAQRIKVAKIFGSDFWSAETQKEINANGAMTGSSYLMPATFQWYGRNPFSTLAVSSTNGGEAFDDAGNIRGFAYPTSFAGPIDATKLTSYAPKVSRVTNAASKICLADGFRYMTDAGLVDFDATPGGSLYGTFTSSGAVFRDSREYCDTTSTGASPRGQQLLLSYRHGGKMNATMWDGHGVVLTQTESRDPTYWYPTGSVFNGVTAHPDASNYYQAGSTTGRNIIN